VIKNMDLFLYHEMRENHVCVKNTCTLWTQRR